MLGVSVVDRDPREKKQFLFGKASQTDYPRRRFFRTAQNSFHQILSVGMNAGYKIRAVIHGNHRF